MGSHPLPSWCSRRTPSLHPSPRRPSPAHRRVDRLSLGGLRRSTDPVDHLVGRGDLGKEGADRGQRGALHLRDLQTGHPTGGRGVADEERAHVADHRLARRRLAADVRLDPGDDDGVDAEQLEPHQQVGVVEGAEVRLLEHVVGRVHDERLVERGGVGRAVEHPLPHRREHLPEDPEIGVRRHRVPDVDDRDVGPTAYLRQAVDAIDDSGRVRRHLDEDVLDVDVEQGHPARVDLELHHGAPSGRFGPWVHATARRPIATGESNTSAATRQASGSRVARVSTARQTAPTPPQSTNELAHRASGSLGKTSTQRESGFTTASAMTTVSSAPPTASPGSGTCRRRAAAAATATSTQPVSHTMTPSRALDPLLTARAATPIDPATSTPPATTSRARLRLHSDVGAAPTASAAASSRTYAVAAARAATPTTSAVPATALVVHVAATPSSSSPTEVRAATGRHGMPAAGPRTREWIIASRPRCGRRGRSAPAG